jgi:endonuclease YncB( thermonuclease family)
MKKRLVGSALIAASLMMVSHPALIRTGVTQQSEFQIKSVTRAIPFEKVPVTLIETIDGDTIKVMVNGGGNRSLFINRYT